MAENLTPAPHHRAMPVTIYDANGLEASGAGVAAGATDSGNPVKVGGVAYVGAEQNATTGQRLNLALNPNGAVYVAGMTDGTAGADARTVVASVGHRSSTTLAGGALPLTSGPYLFNGTTWDKQRTPFVFKPLDISAATAEATIWTPATGKKFRLMGFVLATGVASTLTFKDGTGLATIFVARGAADTPINVNLGNGILSGAADRVLTVTRGTSATLVGTVYGTEE